MYAKVKEHKEYVRDIDTNAVLNVDKTALEKHKSVMHNLNKEKRVQEQINSINDDISEIKEMLRALSNRGS